MQDAATRDEREIKRVPAEAAALGASAASSVRRAWRVSSPQRAAGSACTRSARALPGSPHSSYSARGDQRELAAGSRRRSHAPNSQTRRVSAGGRPTQRGAHCSVSGATRLLPRLDSAVACTCGVVLRQKSCCFFLFAPHSAAVSCACARCWRAPRRACTAAGGPRRGSAAARSARQPRAKAPPRRPRTALRGATLGPRRNPALPRRRAGRPAPPARQAARRCRPAAAP